VEDRLIENKALRVILMGVIEIIGENGLKSVLNYSGLTKYIGNLPPNNSEKEDCRISEVTRMGEGIEEIFGKNGARAILFRVGRVQAVRGLEENPEIAKSAQTAMAGMSESDKAKVILTYTADTLSKQLNTKCWIEQDGDVFFYKDGAVTHCFNRKSDVPVCHTGAGFLAGLVDWAVGNNSWKVEETQCAAMGEPLCTYRIYRETAA
jgi:predicted hydrocarbon binding protein